jgi:hypothetical protein
VTVWFLLVVSLGAVGAFVDCPGAPPFAIAIRSGGAVAALLCVAAAFAIIWQGMVYH